MTLLTLLPDLVTQALVLPVFLGTWGAALMIVLRGES